VSGGRNFSQDNFELGGTIPRGGILAYYEHMAAKISRRRWAALSTLPLVSASQAQPQAAAGQDDLAVQKENLQRWRDQMKKAKLPMATEPAFQFKA